MSCVLWVSLVVSVPPELCTSAIPVTNGQLLASWTPSLSCRRSRSQTWVSVPPQFIFQVNIPHQSRGEETIFKFSTFWFLLLPGILLFLNQTESFCPLLIFKNCLLNYVLCVLSLNYFNTFFPTLRCNSGSLRLYDFPPIYFFFSLPNQRVQRVRMTSYAFLQLIFLPPILSSSQWVVTYRTPCQSSGWIWLTLERSVPHLLSCGTAQTSCWYQPVSQVSFGIVKASPLICLRANNSISATWGHISHSDLWELSWSNEDSS